MSDTSGTDRVDMQTPHNSVLATDNGSGEATFLFCTIFFDLCDEVVDMPLDKSVRCDVLGFVMQHYVNMRGRWFMKIMKGHQKIDQGDAVMKNGATWTRVAAAAACSKAKGTAGKENEQEKYLEAKQNLVDAVDDDQISEGIKDTDDESENDGE
eukprot:scaffold7769_cov53-Attheya_sp.AAC.8